MNPFPDWRDFAGISVEKFFKTTIWQGDHVTVGINCLEAGQVQKAHAHETSDKLYFVVEGIGSFVIGEETREIGSGELVIAAAGISHGVSNNGDQRLSMIVVMAPPFQAR